MSIIGDIFSGFSGAKAAKSAAGAEEGGAQKAQGLELQNQQAAQDFQNNVWNTTQSNEQPYLQAGKKAVNNLSTLASNPQFSTYGQNFQAPTLEQAEQTPGYQFQLQTGANAIDANAAATGNLMSGNTGKSLEDYGQGLASTDYGNLYNQALQTYMTNYNVWNNDTNNQFNRDATVAGMGQNAAGQEGQLGQQAAGTMANVDLTGGAQQAQQINNAAAARASGYLGVNAAWQPMYAAAGQMGNSIFEGLQGGGGFGDVMSSLQGGGFV